MKWFAQKSPSAPILCFDAAVSATTYTRSPAVLWRVGPDRVLVRRTGHDGLDLVGIAAMIWIALDRPRTPTDLQSELSELSDEPIDLDATLASMVASGLIATTIAQESR